MKLTTRALKKIIREAIENNDILAERPWSVEYEFKLTGGVATDSEGTSPDGFLVSLEGSSGDVMEIIVDSYWNPQTGDKSGNSIKASWNGEEVDSSYVPVKFNDGKAHRLVISNMPVQKMIFVSHSPAGKPPVIYLAANNPFADDEDIEFNVETIGNGTATVKLVDHINL